MKQAFTQNNKKFILFSLCTAIILNFDLTIPISNWHRNGMQENGHNLFCVLSFFLLYKFYIFSLKDFSFKKMSLREKICYFVPATLFSIFMILGYSFSKNGNWNSMLIGFEQICKSLFSFIGYFVLFISIIHCIYQYLDQVNIYQRNNPKSSGILMRIFNYIEKYPFVSSCMILFISYLPLMILSYPAIISVDAADQILQGYNLPSPTSDSLNLITENVLLNNYHPVTHTLLIHFFLKIGLHLFHSYNIGLFLYAFVQSLCFILINAYLVKILIKRGVSTKITFLILLYFIFSPWSQNFLFFITKDVYYCISLNLFIILLFQITEGKLSIKTSILLLLASIGIILFRNDGRYIVILTLFMSLFFIKNNKTRVTAILFCSILFCMLLNRVIFPYYHITPGSIREMLSIPFQQTARYIRDAGNEVTPEEKAAISAILDYETISQKYDPGRADFVKNTFNESASREELKQYFKVWGQMLLKHPEIYIQATMNNIYLYFYPEHYGCNELPFRYTYVTSIQHMNLLNQNNTLHTDFHHPASLDTYRNYYQKLHDIFASLPFISLFVTPALYSWIILFWLFYCIRQKNIGAFIGMIPLLFSLAVCCAGPMNAWYIRYVYSIAMCMPASVFLGLHMIKKPITSSAH